MVAVERRHALQVTLCAVLVTGKADFTGLVDLAVAVNIVGEQAIVFAYPGSAALPAVTGDVKEDRRIINVHEFKAVTVKVNRNRFFTATALRTGRQVGSVVRHSDGSNFTGAMRVSDTHLKDIGSRVHCR